MATTANILTLLKFYAGKQKSPIIEYKDFADYLHRYAQHHLEENPELVIYTGTSNESLDTELVRLSDQHAIVFSSTAGTKEKIFVISSYNEMYAERYREIEASPTSPFPSTRDLSKNTPTEILTKVQATDLLYKLMDNEDLNDRVIYSIVFDKGTPAVLFPSSVSVHILITAALKKVQEMLRKEELHDYFLKKLTISNPGKELSIKNFFASFNASPENAMEIVKNTGETYYYWSQMCYFIKQDYTKVKDLTVEDINIIQSIGIIEVATSFYKSKAAEKNQKDGAFKNLDMYMQNPPYYFTMKEVMAMKDSHGIPLLGQYTEAELKNHLNVLSAGDGQTLPELLIFKVSEEEGYFVFKNKVLPLVMRLLSDARFVVQESLKKVWFKRLKEFETLPEMKEQDAFERCLKREVQSCSPVLYSLLNTSFLPVVYIEDQTPGKPTLFRDEELVPYSELLLVSRAELLANTKIKLPVWYSIPIISWIMSLIMKKPKQKVQKDSNKIDTEAHRDEQKQKEKENEAKLDAKEHDAERLSRKQELRKNAKEVESRLVPESSSLEREIAAYENEWNQLLGKKNRQNLTEDVNSLVRDYLRKILRTLPASGFNKDRIESLADTLVKAPGLMKIQNHPALKMYCELYMIKLVKNIP